MQTIKNLTNNIKIITELVGYLWKEKLWWLIPFILVLITVGGLVVFAQSSPITPFLYTVF